MAAAVAAAAAAASAAVRFYYPVAPMGGPVNVETRCFFAPMHSS
jgi:hypothetical protein